MAEEKEDRELFAALEKESNDFEKVSSPISRFPYKVVTMSLVYLLIVEGLFQQIRCLFFL
jgi:hypothetical protein